jgi:hypothetical protein
MELRRDHRGNFPWERDYGGLVYGRLFSENSYAVIEKTKAHGISKPYRWRISRHYMRLFDEVLVRGESATLLAAKTAVMAARRKLKQERKLESPRRTKRF